MKILHKTNCDSNKGPHNNAAAHEPSHGTIHKLDLSSGKLAGKKTLTQLRDYEPLASAIGPIIGTLMPADVQN